MAEQGSHLTRADVERLMRDPSPAGRQTLIPKISAAYASSGLGERERALLHEIFKGLVRDTEERVRVAFAQEVRSIPTLPRDVALTLAADVESVSVPFIETSSVLTDDDLIALIASSDAAKQSAVARRPTVSARVSTALVETDNEDVVGTLMANEGAEVEEATFQRVIERFADSDRVKDPMAHRAKLPPTIAERLVALVSDRLREHLVTHHDLSPTLATDLILQSRERATLSLVAGDAEDGDLPALMRQLHDHGRLSDSLILRAVCLGDIRFLEAALAELTGIPVENAQVLVHDAGRLGLKSLYEKAGLPRRLYPAVRAGVEIAQETDYDGLDNDRERFGRRMVERVLTQVEELDADIADDDVDYLIAKLDQFSRGASSHPGGR